MLSEYLSIWEVAHRWQNTDPNKTDPENLPLEIQDALRYLCRLILEGKLGLYNEIFISTDEDHGLRESLILEVKTLPNEFELAVSERQYVKKILDGYVANRSGLFRCAVLTRQDFPDFWLDDELIRAFGGVVDSADPSMLTKELKLDSAKSFIDKNACQAVAKTLWDIDPNINITQMTKHPSLLNHAGGKNYKGKHTLRDWLYEIVPEHLKNRRGRPRAQSSKDAA